MIELDKVFWQTGLVATPHDEWAVFQEKLAAEDGWIMDGDLGPYDVVEVRLRRADTVILLDFCLGRCAWQAILRSRERVDFWHGLFAYRSQDRPLLMQAIRNHADNADLHVFSNPRALRRFVVAELMRKWRSKNREKIRTTSQREDGRQT